MSKPPICERLIISIYDRSGNMARPYIEAGYPVMLWDKAVEGDIMTEQAFRDLTAHSDSVYGLLAAPPCTEFAASGARWWATKDPEKLAEAIGLVQMVLILKDHFDNLAFWQLENPVGRIERMVPELKPYRKMAFDPLDYGDPYTKRTCLWGEFNANLYRTLALNLYGSMMHKVSSGPNQQRIRSTTPMGFARAFFGPIHNPLNSHDYDP